MKTHSFFLSFFQFSVAVAVILLPNQHRELSWLLASVFFGVSVFYFVLPKTNEANWAMLIFSLFLNTIASLFFIFKLIDSSLQIELFIMVLFSAISAFKIYSLMNFFYQRDFVTEDRNDILDGNELIHNLKKTRTNQGDSVLDISKNKPVLLIFIRHFGCTFCRKNVAEISSIEKQINQLGYALAFVHMSDPSYGDEFFARYFDHPVVHIADPSRKIFKAFGLRRGSLMQLFGPMTWIRGLWAGIFKGHGLGEAEGDSLQLGGYFLLKNEQIVLKHYNQSASEKFTLEGLTTV